MRLVIVRRQTLRQYLLAQVEASHGVGQAAVEPPVHQGWRGAQGLSYARLGQDLATTALYAKVDLATLREVAQPWPATRPGTAR